MVPKTKVKNFNITIISVRAPTENEDDTDKSSFCDTLERVYQTLLKHDAVILIADMSAKFGEGFLNPCTGKYRLYKISKYHKEKPCDFATCRELVTVIAMFPLKNIHLQT